MAKKKAAKTKKKTTKKKSSKKKTKKKASVKKAAPKAERHEVIIKCWSKKAGPKKCFVVKDGKQLKSIKELVKALDEMEDHIFSHHVNWERNDFYNWINDVFKDVELAEKIMHKHDKKDMLLTFYKELVEDLLR